MSRFVRDVDPALLRARAEQLDARAVVVGGELGAMSAHLLRWLLFAPCRLFVLGAAREQLFERLTLAAHAYDTPLDVRRAHDKIELADSLEAVYARLSGSRGADQDIVHFQVVRAESSWTVDTATETTNAPDDPPLRRYLVVETNGARDPELFSPTADGSPARTCTSYRLPWAKPSRQIWRASALTVCGSLPSILKNWLQSVWPGANRSENWTQRRG